MALTVELLVLTLAVVLGGGFAEAAARVFVVAPNIFNANERETVSVLVTDGSQSTRVVVTLKTPGTNEVHQTISETFKTDKQKLVELQVDGSKLGDADDRGRHFVQLRVQCAEANFDKTAEILVNKRTGTVFLQTDKPIYSPSQTVFVQVFSLDERRIANDINIRLEVKNPQGLVISRKEGSTQTGYFFHKFKVSSRPLTGEWSIVAHYGENYAESRESKIEVKRYVLPHFHVKIRNLPDWIDKNTQQVEGEVTALYSFNANVDGKARAVFRIAENGKFTYFTETTVALESYLPTKFTLPDADLTKLKQKLGSYIAKRAKLSVAVIVTETSSGIRERSNNHDIPFVDSPYTISFDGTPPNFMPGFPIEIKISLRYANGRPAGGVSLSLKAVDQNNNPLDLKGDSGNRRSPTNNEGILWEYFDTGSQVHTVNVMVEVEGQGVQASLTVQKSNMPSYIKLETTQYVLPINSRQNFKAQFTDASELEALHYLISSGGRIIDIGSEDGSGSTEINFKHNINHEMSPLARMIVWYFRKDKNVVVSSKSYQVERKCQTEVEIDRVDGGTGALKPGEVCDLYYTGTRGARLVTMVVDESVYYLKNQSRLTKPKMFDEFKTRDLGCASEGGKDAMDVFNLAGFTVISSNGVSQKREQIHCPGQENEPNLRKKRSTEETQDNGQDEETCCEAGEHFANTTDIPSNRAGRYKVCFTSADTFDPTVKCKNKYAECCVKTAMAITKAEGSNSRSSQGEDEDESMKFIEDETDVFQRIDFRESWSISDNEFIPQSGRLQKNVTLIGTITTWVFHAVTISSTEGMCVAEPFRQVSKKDVFVKVHLPHTAVQGEQMELVATVYNMVRYMRRVKVAMVGTKDVCSDTPEGERSFQIGQVPMMGSWTARWPIVPMTVGSIQIVVKLYTLDGHPDIVVKKLNVVPSGRLVVAPLLAITIDPSGMMSQDERWTDSKGILTYTAQRNLPQKNQVSRVKLQVPPDALVETINRQVKVYGDISAPVVEGIVNGVDKHLRKPSGCGEQTMASLGPTVFAARYLRQTRKLTNKLESDAKKKIEAGVMHMLRYRKNEGGFSVWVGSSPAVWLTAFALKSFSQAQEFTDKVTDEMITSATAWLMKQNTPTGIFDKTGLLHHHNMAGGTSGRLSLTAYVYIALIEAGQYNKHQSELDTALNHLAQSVQQEQNVYTLAIVTYALAKGNHHLANATNERLLARGHIVQGKIPAQKYWPTNPANLNSVSQLEVETAGYALLAQLALGNIENSNPIVEWLLRQQYGTGIFHTTQSTVVALQALAEYSVLAAKSNLHMTCTYSIPGENLAESTTHNDANSLVQQRFPIPNAYNDKILNIGCTGTGIVHAYIETSYYSTKSQEENCAFDITAQATAKSQESNSDMIVKVCARLKNANDIFSMPMIEVGIGSVYKPVEASLKELKDDDSKYVDSYEVNDRFVVFYMSKIPSEKDLCLSFLVKMSDRQKDVKGIRPVPVKVYAYYEPEKYKCQTFYDPTGGDEAMLQVKCDKTKRDCKCMENQCPKCYGYPLENFQPPFRNIRELKTYTCKPDSVIDFAYTGTVTRSINDGGGEMRYSFLIDSVGKEGTENRNAVVNNTRTFVMPVKCMACALNQNRRYLILGQDGLEVNDESGHMYQITAKTYIMPLYTKAENSKLVTMEEKKINREHKRFTKYLAKKSCGT